MMRKTILGLLATLFLASAALAQVPSFPQTLPSQTVVGRLSPGAGPSEAIPFITLFAQQTAVTNPNFNSITLTPLNGTSTLITAPTSNALWGVDFSAVTFQLGGGFLRSNGFFVDPSGDVSASFIISSSGYINTSSSITLVAGLNNNISRPSPYIKIAGPVAGFTITGMAQAIDGQVLYLFNTVAQQMTISNENVNSTAVNRIVTLTGGDVVLRAGTSFAQFIYSSTTLTGRWILMATN